MAIKEIVAIWSLLAPQKKSTSGPNANADKPLNVKFRSSAIMGINNATSSTTMNPWNASNAPSDVAIPFPPWKRS